MMTLTLPETRTRRQHASRRRKRQRPIVTMPEVDTYSKYVNKCISSYQKLGLEFLGSNGMEINLPPCNETPSPSAPRSTMASLPSGTTAMLPTAPHPGLVRYNTSLGTSLNLKRPPLPRFNSNLSTQSLPALGSTKHRGMVAWAPTPAELPLHPTAASEVSADDGSDGEDGGDGGEGSERVRITPDILRQMLRDRGFGDPRANASRRFAPQEAPQIYKKWMRETVLLQEVNKFRSRARLDYEMANAKAMAFCEARKAAERKEMARRRKLLIKTWEQGVLQIETLSIADSEEEKEIDLDGVMGEGVRSAGDNAAVSEDKGPVPLADPELNRIRTWLANCQLAAAKGHNRRGNNMANTRID